MIDYEGEYELQHIRQVLGLQKRTLDLFDALVKKVTALAGKTTWNGKDTFKLSDYKQLESLVSSQITGLHKNLSELIVAGVEASFELSDSKNGELNKMTFTAAERKNPALSKLFIGGGNQALSAFIARVEKGLNLSDSVWKIGYQLQAELEQSIAIMIRTGMSAARGSVMVRQFLKEPDKLFRRVRDLKGRLQLSKAARLYKPGQGVYRSSYKNAMRLTRTETNTAYRTADNANWLANPCVVAFEVKTSGNHPKVDICDDMAGIYPKDFLFTGWHPQCLCYAIPVMATKEQRSAVIDAILAGEDVSKVKIDYVNTIPSGAAAYIDENAERISGYKSTPYWVKDNFKEGSILNELHSRITN